MERGLSRLARPLALDPAMHGLSRRNFNRPSNQAVLQFPGMTYGSSCSPAAGGIHSGAFKSKSPKGAWLCRRRPIGASDPACYAFGSGRSVEKLSAAAGEGAAGPTKEPVVKKK